MATHADISGNLALAALQSVRRNAGNTAFEAYLTTASSSLGIYNVKDYGAIGDGLTDDTTALNATWTAVPNGGLMYFPPGTYSISDTLAFTNKDNITIQAENAIVNVVTGTNFSNKAMLDLSGCDYMRLRGLRVQCELTSNKPKAGIVLGRVDAGDGVAPYLDSVWVWGKFSYCALYDVGAELATFIHCRFETTDAVPCYYTSSTDEAGLVVQDTVSNTCKRFYSCSFYNMGASAAHVLELHGVSWEVSLRDSFIYMPAGSHALHLSGTSASCDHLTIENVRVEGVDGADSRLLFDAQDGVLYYCKFNGINYTVTSDYAIDMDTTKMQYCTLDLRTYLNGSTKWMRLAVTDNNYNVIYGRGSAMINVETNAGFFANHVIWFSADNPITGYALGSDYHLRHDNVIIRLYDFDSEVGLASRRMEGSTLTTGATPSIAGHDWFVLVYSSATTITNFTNPTNGQIIHLLAANANTTIAHGTNIKLVGATNWAMPSEATLTLMYYAAGPAWYEIARTSATTTTLTVNADTAETNTVHDMLVMKHSTSGTPAAGFGARQIFALESSTTVGQTAAYLETLWTDATHASRTALLRGSATGNAANTGFFGHWNHSPVAGTALTIIPNAAGDVTEIATFLYAVSEVSGTGTSGGMVTLTPNGGSVSLYSDGTDTLQIACASDGSVTIQRSAGTDEFKVSLWGTWL